MPGGRIAGIMRPVARRKGKSRRRIKDWQRRFREEDITSLDADQTETLQRDRVKLPPWRLKEEMGQVEAPKGPTDEGMVTGLFPGCVQVRVGDEELLCRIAGTFRPPKDISALAVGDQVTIVRARDEHVSGQGDIDKDRADGVLVSRRPRETVLSRPQRRGRYDEVFEKVVAANMEVLLIVTSVRQPRLRPGLVDRFCIIAERGEMLPLVVFNKIDLGEVDEAFAAELATGGIPTVRCSALTGAGLDDLRAALAGRRSILAGASGVGKSAIVNAIVPGADLPTRDEGRARAARHHRRHAPQAARRRADRGHAGRARAGAGDGRRRADLVLPRNGRPGRGVQVQQLHAYPRARLRGSLRRRGRGNSPPPIPRLPAHPGNALTGTGKNDAK